MLINNNLSENELIIMQYLWDVGESTSTLITKALKKDKQWDAAVVRKYLKIMFEKKFISYRKVMTGKRKTFYYYPLISVDQYAASKANRIINRFYDGNLSSMVLGLVQSNEINEKELDELENALRALKEKKGN